MQKYEYKSKSTGSYYLITDYLNEMGEEGWRCIAIVPIPDERQIMLYFERPVP